MSIKQAVNTFCLSKGFQVSCEQLHLFVPVLFIKFLWKGTAIVGYPFWEGEHFSLLKEQLNLTRRKLLGIQRLVSRREWYWTGHQEPAAFPDTQILREDSGLGRCNKGWEGSAGYIWDFSCSAWLQRLTQRYGRSRSKEFLLIFCLASSSPVLRFTYISPPETKEKKRLHFSSEVLWYLLLKKKKKSMHTGIWALNLFKNLSTGTRGRSVIDFQGSKISSILSQVSSLLHVWENKVFSWSVSI